MADSSTGLPDHGAPQTVGRPVRTMTRPGSTQPSQMSARELQERSHNARPLHVVLVFGCLLCLVGAWPGSVAAQFSVLHSFGCSAEDGKNPIGSLGQSGPALYGMTGRGGDHNFGTIFTIDMDGGGYRILHSFAGRPSDGAAPVGGAPAVAGPMLYGVTSVGGSIFNSGTVFRIGADGSGYRLLYSFLPFPFSYPLHVGEYPSSALALDGSTLYGAASAGGSHDLGTIFRIEADGSGFKVLYAFGSSQNDGCAPGGVTLDGRALFGATALGGDLNNPPTYLGAGTLFRIDTDGGNYRILHRFEAENGDGAVPNEEYLACSDGSLYGTTREGGTNNSGTIFRIGEDGEGYRRIYSFEGGPSDGAKPTCPLTLSGSTLYGTTPAWGAYNGGTIFSISTDGTGYKTLYSFRPAFDGGMPSGSVLLAGTKLFGMTYRGGANNCGTIYALDLAPGGSNKTE